MNVKSKTAITTLLFFIEFQSSLKDPIINQLITKIIVRRLGRAMDKGIENAIRTRIYELISFSCAFEGSFIDVIIIYPLCKTLLYQKKVDIHVNTFR